MYKGSCYGTHHTFPRSQVSIGPVLLLQHFCVCKCVCINLKIIIMKLLITLELALLFLATTFQSHNPPGWYQQTLPVNDQINDIFFLDSLKGWIITDGRTSSNDTGYILRTIDGGENWKIQFGQPMQLNCVQFIDDYIGFVVGGSGSGTGRIFKTSDSGNHWFNISTFSSLFVSLFFINEDTGWVCDDNPFDGGLWKTTDGGNSWQRQLDRHYFVQRIFFLNKDTGWITTEEANSKLYKSTNGGQNWNLQFIFSGGVEDVFFVSKDTGWITGGGIGFGISKTINGGDSWFPANNPTPFGQSRLFMVSNRIGWAGSGLNRVVATKDGDNWFYQYSPSFNTYSVSFVDSLTGWGGTSILVHTTDGGPVAVMQDNTLIPGEFTLFQNYPNPFNPVTTFKFEISKPAFVKLIVYDVSGKLVSAIIGQKLNSGSYEEVFDAGTGNYLSSGIYFYSLIIDGKTIDTKKMILIR